MFCEGRVDVFPAGDVALQEAWRWAAGEDTRLKEKAFYARPRSKELLIGHPAFMLAAMAWYRKWPTMVFFGLVILATIGQGSMVETFAHMRTPIYMSFMRGIGGIVLGAGVGAVLMVLVHLWQVLISAAKGRKAEQ